MGKYDPLQSWLTEQTASRVRCAFTHIDGLVGGLPTSAHQQAVWWPGSAASSPHHVQKKAWEAAGYTVESVNQAAGVVTFCRLASPE